MNGPLDARRIQLETDDTVKIELLGLACNMPGWVGHAHSHDFWELLVIVKERPDFCRMIVGGKPYESHESTTIYLIPPGVEHFFMNAGELTDQNLYIGYSYQSEVEPDSLPFFPVMIPVHSPEIIGIVAEMKEIIRELSPNTTQSLKERRLEIMSCVFRLVRYLSARNTHRSSTSKTRNKRLIQGIMQYINSNLDHHIRIDEMAAMFFISPSYLGQIFRQATGTTVKAYHNQMRMEHALQMLQSGEYSIGAVAAASGFFDVTYFSRKCKEYYGVSPSQIMAGEGLGGPLPQNESEKPD